MGLDDPKRKKILYLKGRFGKGFPLFLVSLALEIDAEIGVALKKIGFMMV